MNWIKVLWMAWTCAAAVAAQEPRVGGAETAPGAKQEAPRERLTPKAREALAKARELAKATRGVRGPERSRALELAASAYDRLVAELGAEPPAAAEAAWEAAELWRRQGSLPLAEQDYLYAAKADPARYGQRALLGAADMQRRQQRVEDALETYAASAAVDPRTGRAHDARLWQARILLGMAKVDEAIAAFQAALESAPGPAQAIEAVDDLARAWIAKDDLDSAQLVLDHAEKIAAEGADGDPVVAERLRRQCDAMSARRALQRARDERAGAGADAVRLDEHRRNNGE